MQLNYSKEAIDSELNLFEITTECDWFLQVCPLFQLSVCKYICTTDSVCVCVYDALPLLRLDTEHRNLVSSYSKAGTPGHQRRWKRIFLGGKE